MEQYGKNKEKIEPIVDYTYSMISKMSVDKILNTLDDLHEVNFFSQGRGDKMQ